MGLINYKDIDFNKSINKTLKTFDFNGSEIAVVPYLSINDKYDLVMITLQKSYEKGIYNLVKLNMYFDLHVAYMYTNINFTAEDRADEVELYDTLKRSGFFTELYKKINNSEIKELQDYIVEMQKTIMKYRNTLGAVIGSFIEQLPSNMEAAVKIFENMDSEKYGELSALATQFKTSFLNEFLQNQ